MTDPTPTRAEVERPVQCAFCQSFLTEPLRGKTFCNSCGRIGQTMTFQGYVDMAEKEIAALRERAEVAEALNRDHEEAAADKRRLTRVLDVELNGEAGAAQQASLCDLIGCATTVRERAEAAEQRVAELAQALAALMETSKAAVAEACAAPPANLDTESERMRWLLRQIVSDLPIRRDWLDPSIEREARQYGGQWKPSNSTQEGKT